MRMHDPNEPYGVEEASKCLRFFRLLWKFFKCIFSHVALVSLVVAYCVLGAWAFVELEVKHEQEVKRSIKAVRSNITDYLWRITDESQVLIPEEWMEKANKTLSDFETVLVTKMKSDGWDGDENTEHVQWTFAGALFYSIIVITTIGYGHIAPKTQNGKVVTIFYAILGIPLMLLCLSNIGDVMASSFRFLYWKICCYVCTRPPKPRKSRHSNMPARTLSVRQSGRYASTNRSGGPSTFRRSIRASQRSADSALPAFAESMTRSCHSDTDCSRCMQSPGPGGFESTAAAAGGSLKSNIPRAQPRYLSPMAYADPSTSSRHSDGPIASPRLLRGGSTKATAMATRSLDRKFLAASNDAERTPVLFNKYALDEPDQTTNNCANTSELFADDCSTPSRNRDARAATVANTFPKRSRSVEASANNDRQSLHLEIARTTRNSSQVIRRPRTNNRRREAPSARIMSPMGFAVHRQTYVDDLDYDNADYITSIGGGDDQDGNTALKPVPIWLCVFLVVSYIFGGAFLFAEWETWPFLDSAYFCFITLTTIGFGDLVPAQRLNAHQGIALCSLYLLFGIALLAMSFNLVQEEVINNVKNVAKRLGILKEDHDGDDEDDDECELQDEENDHYMYEEDYHPGRYSAYDVSCNPEIDRFADRPRRTLYQQADRQNFRFASR